MQNVNWQAYYKPGAGAANIIQGNPALEDLKQTYAKREQQRLADNAAFTQQIAKLNFGGAKDADLPVLHNQYSDILNTYGQLRNVTDPKQRAQLGLQLQQAQNGFLYNIEKSKQANTDYLKKAELGHNPNVEVTPDYYKDMQEGAQMSTFDPKHQDWQQRGANWFVPKWDAVKESAPIAKSLVKDGAPIMVSHTDPLTGRVTQTVQTPQTMDKDAFINTFIAQAKNHPGAVRDAKQTTGLADPAEAVAKQAEMMYDLHNQGLKNKVVEKNMGQTLDSKIQVHQSNRIFDQNHPIRQGSVIPEANSQPQIIPFAGGGKVTTTAPNYVPLSLPNKNFAGASGINMTTGKPEKGLNSSDSYSIVGAGDFPIIKQGYPGAGTLAQSSYAQKNPQAVEYKRMVHVNQKPLFEGMPATQHLIPYENLPKNVAAQKDVATALGGLNKTPVAGQQAPQSKLPKQVTSQSEYDAIPKGTQYISNGKVYIKK